MDKLAIFNNMNNDEINYALKSLGSRRITFKKDHIIFANLSSNELIGIILSGVANIITYDYSGNRDILDSLEYNNIFGGPFFYINYDASVIAANDCEILFIDYSLLCNDNIIYQKIKKNIEYLLTIQISKLYEKVEILSKRTIRDKLLCYFNILAKKRGKKTFILPVTYIELADYLSIDRSAMMRELKKLKEQRVILVVGKKISINK